MGNKNKLPRSDIKSSGKVPNPVNQPNSYYSKNPSWRFSKIDIEHDKWSFVGNNILSDIKKINRLKAYEQQTWGKIIGDRNHFITHGLAKEAQDRIIELGLNDDRLFSLTVNGEERIFGILEDGILFFLWYDDKHCVCPSHKKHT